MRHRLDPAMANRHAAFLITEITTKVGAGHEESLHMSPECVVYKIISVRRDSGHEAVGAGPHHRPADQEYD